MKYSSPLIPLVFVLSMPFASGMGANVPIESMSEISPSSPPPQALCTSYVASSTIDKEQAIASTQCVTLFGYSYDYQQQTGICQRWACWFGRA